MNTKHLSIRNNEWSFIRNSRGNPVLYYFGYVYRCDKFGDLKNRQQQFFRWRCITSEKIECRGRLTFNGNKLVNETYHSHPPTYQADCGIEYKSFEDDDINEWLKLSK